MINVKYFIFIGFSFELSSWLWCVPFCGKRNTLYLQTENFGINASPHNNKNLNFPYFWLSDCYLYAYLLLVLIWSTTIVWLLTPWLVLYQLLFLMLTCRFQWVDANACSLVAYPVGLYHSYNVQSIVSALQCILLMTLPVFNHGY